MTDRLIADLATPVISLPDALRETGWTFDKAKDVWQHARTKVEVSKESIENLEKAHKGTTVFLQAALLLLEGKGFTLDSEICRFGTNPGIIHYVRPTRFLVYKDPWKDVDPILKGFKPSPEMQEKLKTLHGVSVEEVEALPPLPPALPVLGTFAHLSQSIDRSGKIFYLDAVLQKGFKAIPTGLEKIPEPTKWTAEVRDGPVAVDLVAASEEILRRTIRNQKDAGTENAILDASPEIRELLRASVTCDADGTPIKGATSLDAGYILPARCWKCGRLDHLREGEICGECGDTLNDAAQQWHEKHGYAHPPQPLAEHLGLTLEQYAAWVELRRPKDAAAWEKLEHEGGGS